MGKYLKSIIQSISAIILNWDILTFIKAISERKVLISQLPTKKICIPGLHCYSCPSAIGACPIGSFQFWLNDVSMKIQFKEKINFAGLYIIGFLSLFGTIAGRFWCGWICPFGFFQDLVNKITKLNFKIPSLLKKMRFVSLFLFVILLPLLIYDISYLSPWFCKLLCPAGTLSAGVPLLLIDSDLRQQISFITYLKFSILGLFLISFLFSRRSFCKTLCPLGAIWGFFNKISFYQLSVNEKCTNCNKCSKTCPMNINVTKTPNRSDCIRCLECKTVCPENAISFKNQFILNNGVKNENI